MARVAVPDPGAGGRTLEGVAQPLATSPRALLTDPGFRRLFSARLASQASDGLLNAALISFVVFSPQHATTAGAIAGALAATLLPYSFVGPFAGIIIDRVPRRQALVVANLLRAAVLCALAVLVGLGHTGLDFELVALVAYSIARFVLATLSAGLPLVVGREQLVPANSLSTTTGGVAGLLGAALGGGLRAVFGGGDLQVGGIVLVAAVSYAAAGWVAARLGRDEIGPTVRVPWGSVGSELRLVAREMADGAAGVWRARPARDALAALQLQRAAYGLAVVATIVLFRNYFTSGVGGLAVVTGFAGAGSVAAAVCTPRGARRFGRGGWMVAAYLLAAVAELAFGLPYTEHALAVAALLIGFSVQAAKICTDSIVQESLPDALRGRAFSVYDMAFNVSYVAAAQLARLLPRSGHAPGAIVLIAAAYGCCALLYLWLRRPSRRGVRRPVPVAALPGAGRRGDPHREHLPVPASAGQPG